MDKPFEELGTILKDIRHKKRETIAEVSQAVEIDMESMARIENGQDRPSEEVLMLLISHFDVCDDEAVKLWSLGKYERSGGMDQDAGQRTVVMLMAVDTRVLYSDVANVAVSKNGVVMNFLQGGDNGQQVPVSRIGMSYEQAKNVLESLSEALDQAHLAKQPKAIPAKITKVSRKKSQKN